MILMPNGMDKDESVSKFKDWYLKPRALGTIRILSGFRSAGKTELFRAALPAVEAAAPSVKTVYIDLEGAEYQAMRTADLMWGLVAGRCPKGRFRLVLDEPSLFSDLVPLLARVQACGRCASVLLICSNNWCFAEIEASYSVARYHLHDHLGDDLSPERLESVWYKTFVRDMLCPSRCADGAGIWHLCSWISEHFSEVTSLRKIAASMSQYGSKFSHPTVDAYLKAMQNAFLVDRVECWDLFGGVSARTGFRVSINYPRLLVQSFAVDKVARAAEINWNEAYLKLRRTHDAVYFPKSGEADFVTIDAGMATCWTVKGADLVKIDAGSCA